MVLEQPNEYKSEWESLRAIASKIDCNPDTLCTWIRQYERNKVLSDNSLAMNESQRIKKLERENRELRRSDK
ncbi:MAG TPA: transposase [Arsenophonus sp.]